MKLFIYHPVPGTKKPSHVECKNLKEAETEYKRLQELYPSREMCLVAVDDYGNRSRIHEGRWD